MPNAAHSLEQYDPARVRALIATTKQIAGELRPLLGNRLRETPTTVRSAPMTSRDRDGTQRRVTSEPIDPGMARV
jgi:hypothetical protein